MNGVNMLGLLRDFHNGLLSEAKSLAFGSEARQVGLLNLETREAWLERTLTAMPAG